ncbi:MAG TPA: T9SS type A sorting domain-containing protein, partial [Flavobacteriales bacterium]|nr:T9SS type A sorting domain-containing protein [Flavobacteriales bacterium]
VELLGFHATAENHDVRLEWVTATESNNDHFTVQRSRDGASFENVTEVHGAGNSMVTLFYGTTDKHPYAGTSYYRVVQVDADGTATPSSIVSVKVEQGAPNIFPNPTADGQVTFFDAAAKNLAVGVYDDAMHLVRETAVQTGDPVMLLNDLPDGNYTLLVRNGEETRTMRVVRQSKEH